MGSHAQHEGTLFLPSCSLLRLSMAWEYSGLSSSDLASFLMA
jgi:hypothetical protein